MAVLSTGVVRAQDPLPSWNDGPTKQAIIEFVKATTTQGSRQFVPTEERVATFDQDGCLWVEHPMYTPGDVLPGRFRPWSGKPGFEIALQHCPGIASRRSRGDGEADIADLEKVGMATITGISVETFQAEVKQWLAEAKHPRWKRATLS